VRVRRIEGRRRHNGAQSLSPNTALWPQSRIDVLQSDMRHMPQLFDTIMYRHRGDSARTAPGPIGRGDDHGR
jgi:hypothetical protein